MSRTIENEITRTDITIQSDGPVASAPLILTIKLYNKVVGALVADRTWNCRSLEEAELIINTFHN